MILSYMIMAESMVGSVHIEIPDTITVNEIDSLSQKNIPAHNGKVSFGTLSP